MAQKLFFHFFLMFISPAFSLYHAFKSWDLNLKRWVLIIFITFYGSVIMISERQDGYRHLENVYQHYYGLSFDQFFSELYHIISLEKSSEGVQEDVYIHVISFFTGSILLAPQLFFVFVSFIYAYFFAGSLFRLFSLFPNYNYSKLFFGFAIVFLLWKNIEGINTVRTWTGLWILFYGCISYFKTGEKKYLILMFIPPLIHIGYFIMAIPVWLVLILGVRKWLYIVIFFLSFFVNFISPSDANQRLQQTEKGREMVQNYYREKIIEGTAQKQINYTWYYQLYQRGIQHEAVTLIAFVLIFSGTYLFKMNKLEASLMSIGLLSKALSNSSWFLSALTERSDIVAGLFILAAMLLIWQRGYFNSYAGAIRFQKGILIIALILFIPFIIYRFADLIQFVSAFVIVMPFIPWIDYELNISIRQAIGKLFGV